MSTTYGVTGLGQTAASTRRVSSFFKILGCVSGKAQTPEATSRLVWPEWQGAHGYRYHARRDRLRRLEPRYRPAGHPIL